MKIGDVVKVKYSVGSYTYLVKIEEFNSDGFRGPYRDITYDSQNQTRYGSIPWKWSNIKSVEASNERVDDPLKKVSRERGSSINVNVPAKEFLAPSGYTFTIKDVRNILAVMEGRAADNEIPF